MALLLKSLHWKLRVDTGPWGWDLAVHPVAAVIIKDFTCKPAQASWRIMSEDSKVSQIPDTEVQ